LEVRVRRPTVVRFLRVVNFAWRPTRGIPGPPTDEGAALPDVGGAFDPLNEFACILVAVDTKISC